MNRKEAERLTRQQDTLRSLGFTHEEAESLRRISMTLHRWHELECGTDNGCIERDETTGKAYWLNSYTGKRYPMADREKGALKRLHVIIGKRNQRAVTSNNLDRYDSAQECANNAFSHSLAYYVQGDPRGAALYILRPDDVPAGQSADSYYSRGICVY